jgi:hypothetical protein
MATIFLSALGSHAKRSTGVSGVTTAAWSHLCKTVRCLRTTRDTRTFGSSLDALHYVSRNDLVIDSAGYAVISDPCPDQASSGTLSIDTRLSPPGTRAFHRLFAGAQSFPTGGAPQARIGCQLLVYLKLLC